MATKYKSKGYFNSTTSLFVPVKIAA